MNNLAKVLTISAMLATVAWFFWNPVGWTFQWEPIVVFLLALAGLLAAERTSFSFGEQREVSGAHPNDAKLLERLLDVLPSKSFIEFLKTHDFLLDFQLEDIEPLRRFVVEWNNAEHEFQDSELEELRKLLLNAGKDLSQKIAKYTAPNSSGWQAVRLDRLKHIDEHEKRFRDEAKIINASSDEFVRIHQELVRKGISKCRQRME